MSRGFWRAAVTICASLTFAQHAQAEITSLPIFVTRVTNAAQSAADFLARQSTADRKKALQLRGPVVDAVDICAALKAAKDAIMVAPLSTFRGCDRENAALGALDFPFVASDWTQARRLLNGAFGFAISEALYKRGISVLTYWDGPVSAISSKKRLFTLDDFKGEKLRAGTSNAGQRAITALGAVHAPMAYAEVYNALQSGVVDGTETSVEGFRNNRLYEVNKYVALSNHNLDPYVVVMPLKTLEQLLPTQRAFLDEALRNSTRFQVNQARVSFESEVRDLRERGVTFSLYSPEWGATAKTPQAIRTTLALADQVFATSSRQYRDAAVAELQGQVTTARWKVSFVTNRKRDGDTFTSDLSGSLLYGEAEVAYEWDEPMTTLSDYEDAELVGQVSQGRPGIAIDWAKVSGKSFPAGYGRASNKMPSRTPMIYVHGFANTFEDAVRRAGWIGWNARRPVVAFAWASKGSGWPSNYFKDQEAAAKTFGALADVLSELGRNYEGRTDFDVVVHSMGAFVLLGALEELEKRKVGGKPIKFRRVIFVAPDVASADLNRQWKTVSKYFQQSSTLYASSNDLALGISRGLMNPKEGERAGLSPPVFERKGIESVYVGRNEFSFTGHSYHLENNPIAEDMVEQLSYGTAAGDRRGCGPADPPRKYFVLHRIAL